MWIAKIKYRHKCILGDRCKKFNVCLQSVAFSVFKENKKTITSSMHYVSGNEDNIDNFILDLKKDKNIIKLERKENMFLLLENAEEKAVKYFNSKLIFVKPVLIDKDGYEYWEVCSWEKKTVSDFINNIKKDIKDFKLLKFIHTKVNDVFFPKLMPDLTSKQKQAIELAIENGYYLTPKKTSLRKLAKLMKVSLATYQQHLRVAEEKLIPNAVSYYK